MLKPELGLPGRIPSRTRGGCRRVSAMALLLFLCAVIALGVVVFFYLRQQDQERAASDRPIILVSEPLPGSWVSTGGALSVSATAFGSRPIRRVELWMDGELKQTLESGHVEGDLPFYANLSLAVSEGPHILSVRAADTTGLIGLSMPVSVVGRRKSGGEISWVVPVTEGETLANIAKTHGTDPAALQAMNPNLGSQTLPPGTMVNVPPPPKQSPPSPPSAPPPDSIPVPIPSPPSTVITGSVPIPIPSVPILTVIKPPPFDFSWLMVPFTYPAPPNAPKDLQGQVIGCDVILHWNDLSDNETRYEVWTALGMLSPQLVASLSPAPAKGPAWYKFFAPQTGWVTFWVEAVNPKGKQPSNEIGLYIDPQKCAWTAGNEKYLFVQIFEMTVKGNYGKTYCYVSYEGNPERRIPENAGDFIQVKGSKADFGGATMGQEGKIFAKLVPIPQDGSLDVEGRCLGWSGATLSDMGPFAGKYAVNDWDGARRSLKSANYEIEFAVKPWTPAIEKATTGKFWYEDPTLPVPYDLSTGGVLAVGGNVDPRERALSWKWNGDLKQVIGFQAYLDGIPYAYFSGASTRQAYVQSAAYCGRQVRWEVAAVSGLAQSSKSPAHVYDLAQCQVFAEIKFKTFHITCSDNAWFNYQCAPGGKYNCDEIDIIDMGLVVNGQVHRAWSDNIKVGVKCGINYSIDAQLTPNSWKGGKFKFDTFIVPISSANSSVRVATRFWYDGRWGEPNMFQDDAKTFTMSLDKWKTFQEDFFLAPQAFQNGVYSDVGVHIRGFEAYGR